MNEKIEAMLESYLETVKWLCPDDENWQGFLFSDEAMTRAENDCMNFLNSCYIQNCEVDFEKMSSYGHNFWLSRNGHGTGFWDKSEFFGEKSYTLQLIAKAHGEIDAYLGDDLLIYFA